MERGFALCARAKQTGNIPPHSHRARARATNANIRIHTCGMCEGVRQVCIPSGFSMYYTCVITKANHQVSYFLPLCDVRNAFCSLPSASSSSPLSSSLLLLSIRFALLFIVKYASRVLQFVGIMKIFASVFSPERGSVWQYGRAELDGIPPARR